MNLQQQADRHHQHLPSPPKKIYTVFVSSTFEDLRDERAIVQRSLLELSCSPVGMELFPASDDPTWDFIKQKIDESDYYVVLIGGRYVSIHPKSRISYTQMEYDYAQEVGKPCIAFIANTRTLMLDKTDRDKRRASQLRLFIEKVRQKPVKFFSSPEELANQVTISCLQLMQTKPAAGYVRSGSPQYPPAASAREQSPPSVTVDLGVISSVREVLRTIQKRPAPPGKHGTVSTLSEETALTERQVSDLLSSRNKSIGLDDLGKVLRYVSYVKSHETDESFQSLLSEKELDLKKSFEIASGVRLESRYTRHGKLTTRSFRGWTKRK